MRIIILAALVAVALATRRLSVGNPALDSEWEVFKVKYTKNYGDMKEESIRRLVWESNMQFVAKHNAEYAAGLHTFFVGENQFADMSNEEFRVTMNGYRAPAVKPIRPIFKANPNVKVGDSVDWRNAGIVTPVKNQGQCGSCWSFATTGSLEGQYAKSTGTLLSFSEQQLVDCDSNNGGCNGGWPDVAFQYIQQEGIELESDYPYYAQQYQCQYDESKVQTHLSTYTDVTSGDEDDLQEACGQVGPIAVAIDASHQSFQMYSGGVYQEPNCSPSQLDHAVLVAGYGTDGMDYWLVKNSWGGQWGEAGYIRMARNQDNQCGIATSASYPTI